MHVVQFLLTQRGFGPVVDAPSPAIVVIDGHPHMAAQGVVAKRWDQGVPREQPLRDAPVVAVGLTHSAAQQGHAKFGFFDVEHHVAVGLDVVQRLDTPVHGVGGHVHAVHIRHVGGVNAALHGLQVIGALPALGHKHMAGWQRAPLHLGLSGLMLGRPHISPDHATALDAGVAHDLHLLAHLRRRGHIHAVAQAIEFDAVVRAANALFFVATKKQRHAAVRAKLADQTGQAIGVAESQQLFAHDLHPHLRAIGFSDFAGHDHRHPIAAHQIAHGRASAGLGQGLGHFGTHTNSSE